MKTLIIMILSVLTMSCATPRESKNEAPNIIMLKFGSSGGFTGLGNQYVIKPDGKVYKNSTDTLSFLNQVEISDIESIRKQLIEIGFEDLKLLEKGNMTYFITVQTSTYQNKVSWSNQTQNDSIKQFYKTLVQTLK